MYRIRMEAAVTLRNQRFRLEKTQMRIKATAKWNTIFKYYKPITPLITTKNTQMFL